MRATMSAGGRESANASAHTTTNVSMPSTASTGESPAAGTRLKAMFPKTSADTPKPIMSTPEENPTLSGNHMLVLAMTEL